MPTRAETGSVSDGPGQRRGRGGRAHRRPQRAEVNPGCGPVGRVELEAHPDHGAGPRRATRSIQVQLGRVVDHHGDRRGRLGLTMVSAASAVRFDRRVTDHDVVESVALQPDRLGQRVREQAGEAGLVDRAPDQLTDPQRLGGQPDRPTGRPADQIGRVGAQGRVVQNPERRVEIAARRRGAPRAASPRPSSSRSVRHRRQRGPADPPGLAGQVVRASPASAARAPAASPSTRNCRVKPSSTATICRASTVERPVPDDPPYLGDLLEHHGHHLRVPPRTGPWWVRPGRVRAATAR